ncbi:MAG: hypothetical protein AB2826_22635 [Candidatus Thiodiazotropha sp.]
MKYSDWQLNRIRDALQFYKSFGVSDIQRSFSWADVRTHIEMDTGVEIGKTEKVGAERLRQFVEGVRTPDGGKKYPVPIKESLEAIVTFLTGGNVGLLSEDELNEYVPERQAPMRLIEYLYGSGVKEVNIETEKLLGRYQARTRSGHELIISELTLLSSMDNGLVQAIETEEFYCIEAENKLESWSPAQRRKERNARYHYGGWAIFTPDENSLFFLKKQDTKKNRFYSTVAMTGSDQIEATIRSMVLLQHSFSPVEMPGGLLFEKRHRNAVLKALGANIRHYCVNDVL